VSGKGAAAAAVTGLARHTIRTACLTSPSPAAVLETLNRAMLLSRREQVVEHFCTVLLAWIRPLEGGLAVELATGGHPPALTIQPDGRIEGVGPSGPPAGWFPDAVFGTSTRFLEQGDTLLLFTDGVTDTPGEDGRFGDARLQAAVAAGAAAPDEVLARVKAALAEFQRGTVLDDRAMLALQYAGLARRSGGSGGYGEAVPSSAAVPEMTAFAGSPFSK
jgi:phosphoserine phosphatase RsbU/P